jgi:lysyl-tRNA synthetase class 2
VCSAGASWGSSSSSTSSTAAAGFSSSATRREAARSISTWVTSSGVTGRPAKARRGEPSIAVDQLVLLGKIRSPLPDTFHGITDPEVRYRKRYLDLLMNEDSRRDAIVRARMITAIRAYLDGEGFIEVETPVLQPRYGGAFAEPFVTHSNYLDRDVFLRIADELYLKRLIVGGLEKVYELAKDFRNEGVSYKHSPEFTQLEWYEAYTDYRDTMERTEMLVSRAAETAIGGTKATFRGHDVDLAPPWQRVRFVDALEAEGAWSREPDEVRARLDAAGVDTSADKTWAQLVDHAYSHFVEPKLIQPTFVHDWPIETSPFARKTDDDPMLVERFECVVGGMEFANAFSELNDSEGASGALRDAGGRARSRARPMQRKAIQTSSRRCRTACRRRAAAASAWTGSLSCSRGATRCAT